MKKGQHLQDWTIGRLTRLTGTPPSSCLVVLDLPSRSPTTFAALPTELKRSLSSETEKQSQTVCADMRGVPETLCVEACEDASWLSKLVAETKEEKG